MSNIEQIKRIPIEETAQRLGMEVTPAHKAICFKGHDTEPSLSFNISGNYFKCFGCGIGGSTIDLVKEYQNCSLQQAVRWLESEFIENNTGGTDKRPTLTSPSVKNPGQPTKGKPFRALYKSLVELCNPDEAIEYMKSRGISKQVTQQQGITALPTDSRNIRNRLIEIYGQETLIKSGLLAVSKKGNPYITLYKNRLIIPYYDIDGDIINLQGRDIDGASKAKYRFLPEIQTSLYNMKQLPPGSTIYLCEGALDVLSFLQLGIMHPVGIPGVNNFRQEQIKQLLPYKIIIASDEDTAGREFYTRVKKIYLQKGKELLRMDYDKLKAEYNVHTETKDLNDIVQQADYRYYRDRHSKMYSHVLQETYQVQENGCVLFDDGTFYTKREMQKISGLSVSTMQTVHKIKRIFEGVIQ